MDILIYGAGGAGRKLLHTLENYNEIKVAGFIDCVKKDSIENIPVLTLQDIIECYKFMPIVISIANFYEKRKIYEKLKTLGWENIYSYLRKDYCSKKDFFAGECVSLNQISENSLFYAEMGIIDVCNLNCKGCNHYSPIFEKKYPNVDVRIRDVERIVELYDAIVAFGLIGGEPFLSPDIEEYIKRTRNLLPKTEIEMVTNGLLIPKLDSRILECIKDNNITISISQYVPTLKIIDKIKSRLEEYNIDYVLKSAMSKKKFYKTLSLKKDSIYEKKCISRGCINICDGKIAKCPSVLYIDELNKKFDVEFPNEGIYSLDSFSDGRELNLALEKRIPLCEHCINYQIDWEPCSKEQKLEDFVVVN